MKREEFFANWSALHGGAEIAGLVKGWLVISFAISRPLVRIKVSPNVLSIIGVIAAVFTYTEANRNYCIALLGISLLSDGIDGSVAILSNKASKRGAMVDALCDRIGETFWALAFYKLGAPAWLIATAWVLAFTQEYSRARIAGLGDYRIDVVTIAERPVRASFLAVAILAYDIKVSAVTTLAVVWTMQQAIALVTVMRSGYTRLSATDRLGD
jgi:archaetidylinositol phosphate synthase